jgi:histidine triad (HIT) family protein
VSEDAAVLAFMDIGPVVKGHPLVIPQAHHTRITAPPAAILGKLIAVVQRVAQAQTAGLQADGVSVTQANGRAANQVVPHLHFHVIPRYTTDGQHLDWIPKRYADPAEMQDFAARIAQALPAQALP